MDKNKLQLKQKADVKLMNDLDDLISLTKGNIKSQTGKDIKNSPNFVHILDMLLKITHEYIHYINLDDAELSKKLGMKLHYLKDFVDNRIYKNKIETFERNMMIGQFIDVLIENGLSRTHAIDGTVNWKGISEASVRICNENYRKIYSNDEKNGNRPILFVRKMVDEIRNKESFESDHPHAQKAFLKAKDYYIKKSAVFDIILDDGTFF